MVKVEVVKVYAKLVVDYLDNITYSYPNKIAVVDNFGSQNFEQIRINALRIGTILAEKGYYKKPIVLYLDKSIECFYSMFGVAYSGNYYTIIDTSMPIERIKKICTVLDAKLIVTDKKNFNKLKTVEDDYEFLYVEEVNQNDYDESLIDSIKNTLIDTDLLYVLFTSGSTGNPKGVCVSHKNVITYMEWSAEAFGFDTNTVFGNQTPFYFSMSVLDVFQTVRSGSKLVIIPKKMFSMMGDLLDYLYNNSVNTIYWVPSALCQLATVNVLDNPKLKQIEKILFAGEVMPTKQLNNWRKSFPNALFANLFGPTEFTDICTYYVLDRELKDDESVPIGRASDNTDVFVLDDENNLVNDLREGELYLRGSSVAFGYYNDINKTKEVFVQNPLNNLYPEIVYKSGDLVRYNEYGELIYISRKDYQIKHMGYRIELGEIEMVSSSIEDIDRVCCVYDDDNSEIVLFYCGRIEESNIKGLLKNKLPKYMIPSKYIKLEKMPLNYNGKINRKELKEFLQ